MKSTITDCEILNLNKIHNRAGNITIVESGMDIPFEIKRIYYLYDIPAGESRGGHAHRELQQIIIAASGSFDVVLNDGNIKRTVTLKNPNQGLFIVNGIWRDIINFSGGSVCLVIASHIYDESDYIRDYLEYLSYKNVRNSKI